MKLICPSKKSIVSFFKPANSTSGFTLVELLIVIAILGILAAAVLAAINPVEQVNRASDTGALSDSEQFLSGADRYHAAQLFLPWMNGQGDASTGTCATSPCVMSGVNTGTGGFLAVGSSAAPAAGTSTGGLVVHGGATLVIDQLATGGTQEVQAAFVSRVKTANILYAYNQGIPSSATYVCFQPKSGSFLQKAKVKCSQNGYMSDVDGSVKTAVCGATPGTSAAPWYCLP